MSDTAHSVIRGTDMRVILYFKGVGDATGFTSATMYVTNTMNASGASVIITKTMSGYDLAGAGFVADLVPSDTESLAPDTYIFEGKLVLGGKTYRTRQTAHLTVDERATAAA